MLSAVWLALQLRYDIGSAIWDNTGRGNEEADWSGQSEAGSGLLLTNQKLGEAMKRRPLCYELSDIEPMSTTTARLVSYLFIVSILNIKE